MSFGSIFYTPLIHWILGKDQPNEKYMIKKVMSKTILKPEKMQNQLTPPIVEVVIFMMRPEVTSMPVHDIYNSMLFAQKLSYDDDMYFHMEPRQLKKKYATKHQTKIKETKKIQYVDQKNVLTVAWPKFMDEYFEEPLFSKYNDVISWETFMMIPGTITFMKHATRILRMIFRPHQKNELLYTVSCNNAVIT